MANELEQLKPISALAAIREIKINLDAALAPYALQIGKKTDALDYEKIQQSRDIINLLLEANRG